MVMAHNVIYHIWNLNTKDGSHVFGGKILVPMQNLGHVLLGVPSNLNFVPLGLFLGDGLLAELNEFLLARICKTGTSIYRIYTIYYSLGFLGLRVVFSYIQFRINLFIPQSLLVKTTRLILHCHLQVIPGFPFFMEPFWNL